MLPKKVPFKHGDEPIVQGTEITYTMPGGKKKCIHFAFTEVKECC